MKRIVWYWEKMFYLQNIYTRISHFKKITHSCIALIFQTNFGFKVSAIVLFSEGDTRSQSSRVRGGGLVQLARPARLQFQSRWKPSEKNKNWRKIKLIIKINPYYFMFILRYCITFYIQLLEISFRLVCNTSYCVHSSTKNVKCTSSCIKFLT